MEKILSLKPDLVLASDISINNTIPSLEKVGVLTYVVESKNLSGILTSIKKVGIITGKKAEADALADEMESRIKAVSDRSEALQKKRVLYIVWHDPVKTVGTGSFEDEIIELAGEATYSMIFPDILR